MKSLTFLLKVDLSDWILFSYLIFYLILFKSTTILQRAVSVKSSLNPFHGHRNGLHVVKSPKKFIKPLMSYIIIIVHVILTLLFVT